MKKIIQMAVAMICSLTLVIAVPESADSGSVEQNTQTESSTEAASADEDVASTTAAVTTITSAAIETTTTKKSILPDTVYTTEEVNIRYYASTDSEILVSAAAGTKLTRTGINVIDGWDMVLIEGEKYYVYNSFLTSTKPNIVAEDITNQIQEAATTTTTTTVTSLTTTTITTTTTTTASTTQIDNSEISSSDLRYLSAIIYAEANGQCTAGQQAVGIIVMNRSASSSFANGVYNVIYQSGQFTPATNGSLNTALSLYDSGSLPDSCVSAAKYALQGNKTVYYNNTIYDLSGYYYFSRYISDAKLTIEDHMFK